MKKKRTYLLGLLLVFLCSSCERAEEIEKAETRASDEIVWTPQILSTYYDYYQNRFVLCVNYSRHYIYEGTYQVQMRRNSGVWEDILALRPQTGPTYHEFCAICQDSRSVGYIYIPYNANTYYTRTDYYEFRWKSGCDPYFNVYYGRDWSNIGRTTVTSSSYATNHTELVVVAKAKTVSSIPIKIYINSGVLTIPSGETMGTCTIWKDPNNTTLLGSIYLGSRLIGTFGFSYNYNEQIIVLDDI